MKRSKKDIFKYILMLICLLGLSNSVFADFDNSDPQISSVFVRGANLLYDCNGNYLVCASDRSFSYCSGFNPDERPCKLIKKFATESDCHNLQLKLSSDNFSGEFCN